MTDKIIHGAMLQALLEGKKVQRKHANERATNAWIDVNLRGHDLNKFKDESFKFRLAPETIILNGFEIPKPVSARLSYGEAYYVPLFGCNSKSSWRHWYDTDVDYYYLRNNLIQRTKEGAEQLVDAMLNPLLKKV